MHYSQALILHFSLLICPERQRQPPARCQAALWQSHSSTQLAARVRAHLHPLVGCVRLPAIRRLFGSSTCSVSRPCACKRTGRSWRRWPTSSRAASTASMWRTGCRWTRRTRARRSAQRCPPRLPQTRSARVRRRSPRRMYTCLAPVQCARRRGDDTEAVSHGTRTAGRVHAHFRASAHRHSPGPAHTRLIPPRASPPETGLKTPETGRRLPWAAMGAASSPAARERVRTCTKAPGARARTDRERGAGQVKEAYAHVEGKHPGGKVVVTF